MAQHDLNIANQSFPSFRSDLNNALSAIQTTHSGTSRPTGAVAGQIWLDTTSATSPTLKYYDGADDISLATIDHSANTVNWLDSTVSITGLTTTATGTVLTLSDTATTSTVNLIIDNDKEIRFREATANGTNYISLSAPASLSADVTYTLPVAPTVNNQALISTTAGVMAFTPYTFPTSDGSASQVLQTNGSGVLSFATASAGITQADQWRLTTSLSMSTAGITDITANLERNDSSGFGYVGTGMTESSGIFTFPSTGYYLILVQAMVNGNGNQTDFASVHIKITTNNSTYSDINTQTISHMAKSNGYATSFGSFIFYVTSTTNCKIKFTQDTATSGIQLYGNTNHTGTGFTFIRLGDT